MMRSGISNFFVLTLMSTHDLDIFEDQKISSFCMLAMCDQNDVAILQTFEYLKGNDLNFSAVIFRELLHNLLQHRRN